MRGKESVIQIQKLQPAYKCGSSQVPPFYHDTHETSTKSNTASGTFKQRIGSTVYRVNVYSSKTNKEPVNEKIARLVKNDIATGGMK